ncbi:MAG: ATP-binding protein [Gemmataceae bacterium]
MPQITKRALSQFIRSGCERQLALELYPDNATFGPERQAHTMPEPQPPRPGLAQVQEVGNEWQAEKLNDLTQTFGPGTIVGTPFTNAANQVRYRPFHLQQAVAHIVAHPIPVCFIVEAGFDIGLVFQSALGITAGYAAGDHAGHPVVFGSVRPDIIEVLPPLTFPEGVRPDGTLFALPAGAPRRQLRVIDIKLTARASQGYFAEVAFYSMALAGWLAEQGLDGQFVVVPDGAVWPGSHEASRLFLVGRQMAQHQIPDPVPPALLLLHGRLLAAGLTPDVARLVAALEEDLEPTPFEVFAIRVRRFLQVEVPAAIGQPWRNLQWHVDSRCAHCEYLGEPRHNYTPDPDHCMPLAANSDHLSRVAFVSQGARLSLIQAGVPRVADLAMLPPGHSAFNDHQTLRATRTVVAGRALCLQPGQQANIPNQSGTSAGMPRWADLRVFLSVDFDVGSAITVAFGLKAFWYEPRPQNSSLTAPRKTRAWPNQGHATTLVVDQRDLAVERRELLAFLQQIHDILSWCQQQDDQTLALPALSTLSPQRRQDYRTRVQFYLWDSLQYEHLARVIGRHLPAILANHNVNYLAWLFPPEDLLPNPDLATRRSPITIVGEVVRSLLAAPIIHHYGLIDVARNYHDPQLPANIAQFYIHPLFHVPLSDQIPSERAHEIWGRIAHPTRPWQAQMATFMETVRKRLSALETITKRLEADLRSQLGYNAPLIEVGPPERRPRMSVEGQLWFAFARLNAALAELEVHQIRAMPPHERAARFKSARLDFRLTGAAELAALTQLGLPPRAGRRVYELSQGSREVKAKVGDFNFALAPKQQTGFLDRKLASLVQNTPLAAQYGSDWSYLERATSVTVVGLDRNRGLIALDPDRQYVTMLDDLTNAGIANFDRDVMLDPVHKDFFTDKLDAALRSVGNPPLARANPMAARVAAATSVPIPPGSRRRGSNASGHTPPADFLWNAGAMGAATVTRNLPPVRSRLMALGVTLNASQWRAWEDALTHRARLVWGPPGTGKSQTVKAIVAGAVLEAHLAGRALRVLVSASTYNAIDNVLLDIAADLHALLTGNCATFRVRSTYQPPPGNIAPAIDAELSRRSPSPVIRNLRALLQGGGRSIVVGAPPEQVHNLLTCEGGDAQDEWFDLIVIDEASQMDVAHAVLPLCGVATDGAVVLAGDPLQLPPIHQAEAPAGLEDLVGSVYRFFERVHNVPVSALDVNYRSNDTIVEFARRSGYRAALTSNAPNLRLDLTSPLPAAQPPGWPATLHWTSDWAGLLAPDRPAVCFVYDDRRSSQMNRFEADAVAALAWLLHGRLRNTLLNDPAPPPAGWSFWTHGVGIVTPHRAQQGLIIGQLQGLFPPADADAIRDAVDTVERFQGQQRDVIVASFALGDPDQIEDEEEFLMSLNRFNVMASRARAKLVVLVSRQVVDHLASEVEVLRESRLLKVFVETFCDQHQGATLGSLLQGNVQPVPGEIRWH